MKIIRYSNDDIARWLISQGVKEWENVLIETDYHGKPIKLLQKLSVEESDTKRKELNKKPTKKLKLVSYIKLSSGRYALGG